jgi:putative transposase
MSTNEVKLRKQAVQKWLSGEPKKRIAHDLGKSRNWVNYWLSRYQADDPEGSLQDGSKAPKHPYHKWSEDLVQMALNSRQLRQEGQQPGYRYSLVGAEAIHYELKNLGIMPVPPVRTIHSWLKARGTIVARQEAEARPPKPYPTPVCQAVNDLQELDLKGPFYLTGSDQKYYLSVLREAFSKRVALTAIQDKQMTTILDFLLPAWRKLGLPKVLQMDNGLEFRGSNRYPRSPGQLLRVCLDLGVEPLFIPPHEPWRNGVVENLNGLLERLFLQKQIIQDYAHLQACTQEVETAINTAHRLSALEGKTPQEAVVGKRLVYPPEDYVWRKRDLRLVKGKISFIRLVRKSGRITLCAADKFEIGEEYAWQYVRAIVDVEAQRLDVYLSGNLIKSFDYR